MNTKTCSVCKEEKSVNLFYKNCKSSDGLQYQCIDCSKSGAAKWQEENKEKALKRISDWGKANYEKTFEYKRKWREKNRAAHNAANAKWKKENPAKSSGYTRTRNGMQKKATPSWANYSLMDAFYKEAVEKSKLSGIPHHVDHIIPILNEVVCGLHWEGNMQIISKEENLKKGNKLIEQGDY